MLSRTVNNRISQLFNLITRKKFKAYYINLSWYAIKDNEKLTKDNKSYLAYFLSAYY